MANINRHSIMVDDKSGVKKKKAKGQKFGFVCHEVIRV